jgi:hypothetical protein
VPPGTLSKADKEWAARWYPPLAPGPATLEPFASVAVELAAGQQLDFVIKPAQSRKYTIETKGATDTLMVLFEEIDGTPRELAGDDDSGEDRNAKIVHKLFKGRKYFVRLRVFYPGESGVTSLMLA